MILQHKIKTVQAKITIPNTMTGLMILQHKIKTVKAKITTLNIMTDIREREFSVKILFKYNAQTTHTGF